MKQFPANMNNRPPLPGLILLLLLLLFFLPVILILGQAFLGEDGFTLDGFMTMAGNAYYGRLFSFTFIQAFFSALLSVILALPAAALFVHRDFPLKKLLLSLTTLSFILPPILVVLSFVIFWGHKGTVNSFLMSLFSLETPPLKVLYSFKAIILAHMFYNIPLALRYIYAGWSALPQSQYEAASVQGTGRRVLFRRIILPQIKGSLYTSFLIIFLYCFMSFVLVLVLGGGPKYSTVEVEVYRLMKLNRDYSLGGALAFSETLVCLFLLFLYREREKRTTLVDLDSSECLRPRPLKGSSYVLFFLYLFFWGLFFGGPLFSLAAKSFQGRISRSLNGGFTLLWYKQIFSQTRRSGELVSLKAVGNSLYYALFSTFFSLAVGTTAAFLVHRRKTVFPRLTELLLLLPMGISSIVMALGYLFLSSSIAPGPFWGDLFVILAHSFIALPFSYRSISLALDKLDPALRESALIQGASESQSLFHVELPLLRRSLIGAALFSFALSMGEVNAVLILASPEKITLPLAVYRLIGSYNFHGAAAMGTILMLICAGAFFLINLTDREL